jgi:hypothetical protein
MPACHHNKNKNPSLQRESQHLPSHVANSDLCQIFVGDNMSDAESVVSSVFENISSTNDLSETETIESSESERLERNTLTPYEYVSVTINIEATLACDFKRHSKYYRTQGKFFPVDSSDAVRRMYQLIDEFLETYDIPTARRGYHYSNDESLEYPRFIPSPSIMLAFRWLPLGEFEFLPVYIRENESTRFQGSSLDRVMYAAINPSVPSTDHQLILRSNRPFAVGHTLLQGLSFKHMFTIGTITNGPQTLLRHNSIQLIEKVFPIAKGVALARFYAQSQKDTKTSQELPCPLRQQRQLQQLASVIGMDDIVVDVNRSIGISPSMRLTTGEEIERVMEISEYFSWWCMKE